jgi:hypothetical protein
VSVSAAQYRALQLAIRARAIAELLAAWPLFRGDLESWRRFFPVAAAIVSARHRDSAALGLARLRERAVTEGIALPEVRLPDPPPAEQLDRSFGATGLAGTWRAMSVGMSVEAAREVGFARLAMAAGRHVMDGGRQVILGAAEAEPRIRWRRVAAPSACAFCAMLASRGPVYASETVDFQAHDGCACVAEPAFPGEGRSSQERALYEQWREATAGLSGADALRAFRRARSGSA